MPAPDDGNSGDPVEAFELTTGEVYILSLKVVSGPDSDSEWELQCPDSATGNRAVYVNKREVAVRGAHLGDTVAVPMRLRSEIIDADLEVTLFVHCDDGSEGDSVYAYPSACAAPITVPLDTIDDVEAFLRSGD